MFLLSFVVVLYLTVSGVRRLADVDFLARCLVAGRRVVAVFAIVEARTGFNVFNHLVDRDAVPPRPRRRRRLPARRDGDSCACSARRSIRSR